MGVQLPTSPANSTMSQLLKSDPQPSSKKAKRHNKKAKAQPPG